MKYILLLLLVPVLLAANCRGDDGCTTEDTRCKGSSVEVCASDNVWDEIMDCDGISSQTGNEYVCCYDAEHSEYSCLAQDQCGAPPGGD